MTEVHIKSENQSGGITAQNIGGVLPSASKPPSRAREFFWWIVGIAGVIGAVASVMQLMK